MKGGRSKRVGSLLCFSKPDTTEEGRTGGSDPRPDRGGAPPRRTPSGRTLSRLFRSFSADPKPTTKSGGKTSPILPKLLRSISSLSRRGGKVHRDYDRPIVRKESFGKSSPDDDANFFSSSSSSTRSSSSRSSSSSSCLSPVPPPSCSPMAAATTGKRTSMPPSGRGSYGYATGLCFVLMSLVVMMFCGRVCAILWTATWLCLLPQRRPPGFDDAAALRRRRAEEEKRRVVMEGFLHRSRKGLN
ncbi:uncharacterized protein M6B38_295890 [Iris pallida]|uniref:Uncharacterized protein n=1 Tax=Iris pallida TaxID=29817 RepID=A0AAX6HSX2_IRIPA|nr:uncharacterized protein M6B38_295890 [Iris pallida]